MKGPEVFRPFLYAADERRDSNPRAREDGRAGAATEPSDGEVRVVAKSRLSRTWDDI